jgi:hypothetical protein
MMATFISLLSAVAEPAVGSLSIDDVGGADVQTFVRN